MREHQLATRSWERRSAISGVPQAKRITPARIEDATLIMVAFQNEYVSGSLALPGARCAVEAARHLLDAARSANTPVLHIAHYGVRGQAFDPSSARSGFAHGLSPRKGETVIETPYSCALPAMMLPEHLAAAHRRSVIVAGFMTDLCVSTTAETAQRLHYRVTVDASACATRGLPGIFGKGLDAATMQAAALNDLAARHVLIAEGCAMLT